MSELIMQPGALMDLKDLSNFVLIGRERLAAVRAAIRAIDKVGVAAEVYEQKMMEAQELAEAVLDSEVRLGQLRSQVQRESGRKVPTGGQRFVNDSADRIIQHREEDTALRQFDKEAGLERHVAQYLETLAAHPQVVESVKQKARENGSLVTRADALKAIRQQKKPEPPREVLSIGNQFMLKDHDIRQQISFVRDGSVDMILTEPPAQIQLWRSLARVAQTKLKDGGVLAVVLNVYMLPNVSVFGVPMLHYAWMYATQVAGGKINTYWRPVVVFTKGGEQHYQKRQDINSYSELIRHYCAEGSLVVDPFCGRGGAGIHALKAGCRFIGLDIDKGALLSAQRKLSELSEG